MIRHLATVAREAAVRALWTLAMWIQSGGHS